MGQSRMSEGRVQLRSNIVVDPERWDLVPGDALEHYASHRLRRPYQPTSRQHDEHMYYVPCSRCGRGINQIQLEGCEACPHGPSTTEQAVAVTRDREVKARVAALRRERSAG